MEQWQHERQAIYFALRAICNDHGDNDWPDDADLRDVIEKMASCTSSMFNRTDCFTCKSTMKKSGRGQYSQWLFGSVKNTHWPTPKERTTHDRTADNGRHHARGYRRGEENLQRKAAQDRSARLGRMFANGGQVERNVDAARISRMGTTCCRARLPVMRPNARTFGNLLRFSQVRRFMSEPVTDGQPMKRMRTGKASCFCIAPRCPHCKGSMRVVGADGLIRYRKCVKCGHRAKTISESE